MAAIVHDHGPLEGVRFLSCEDITDGPGALVYNPLAAATSVVILACPLSALRRWFALGLPRRTGAAILIPLLLTFVHNLLHHTFGPPALDIDSLSTVMWAFSVPALLDASVRQRAVPSWLCWLTSGILVSVVCFCAGYTVAFGGQLQKKATGAVTTISVPTFEIILGLGTGASVGNQEATYLWRKRLLMAVFLFPQILWSQTCVTTYRC